MSNSFLWGRENCMRVSLCCCTLCELLLPSIANVRILNFESSLRDLFMFIRFSFWWQFFFFLKKYLRYSIHWTDYPLRSIRCLIFVIFFFYREWIIEKKVIRSPLPKLAFQFFLVNLLNLELFCTRHILFIFNSLLNDLYECEVFRYHMLFVAAYFVVLIFVFVSREIKTNRKVKYVMALLLVNVFACYAMFYLLAFNWICTPVWTVTKNKKNVPQPTYQPVIHTIDTHFKLFYAKYSSNINVSVRMCSLFTHTHVTCTNYNFKLNDIFLRYRGQMLTLSNWQMKCACLILYQNVRNVQSEST